MRARAKHQVLVHTVEGKETAWYDTERGMLPVSPEVLEEALQSGPAVKSVEALRDDVGEQAELAHLTSHVSLRSENRAGL